MYDICSIGHITLDKIVTKRNTVYMSGGTAFYMTYGISCLPKDVSYQLVTKVGHAQVKDVEKIKAMGIDTICYPSRHTVYFENIYGEDSNERKQRVLAKADPFTIDDVRPLQAKVFHLGSLLADDFAPEVVEHLATKGLVSIDVQGYLREVVGQQVLATGWKDKERILSCTGILKLNESEAEVITGNKDLRDVARKLASYGVKEVIITLGSYGSMIYADGTFYDIPPYVPNCVVDATGCGDTYSTGYLWCRAQGAGYAEAGHFATAMCALKLEHNGPFDKTIEDIQAIIGKGTWLGNR